MIIKASKERRELQKLKDAWQEKYDARKAEYDAQCEAYDQAHKDWKNGFESRIREAFAEYLAPLPDIKIYITWGIQDVNNVAVTFKYTEGSYRRFTWRYVFELRDDGSVLKELSDWRGINDVTPECAQDLVNSANLIKAIAEFDWSTFLKDAKDKMPDSDDYVTIEEPAYDPEYRDKGYSYLINEEIVKENAGNDLWFKSNLGGGDFWFTVVEVNEAGDKCKYVYIDANIPAAVRVLQALQEDITSYSISAERFDEKGVLSQLIKAMDVNEVMTSEELKDYITNKS